MPFVLLAADASWWANVPITPAQFSLLLLAGVFLLMIFSNLATDLILIGAVVVLLGVGILRPDEALAGLTKIAGVVPVIVAVTVSLAVMVRLPTVLSVALKMPVPPVSAALAGKAACASVLVNVTMPV